MPFKSKAQVRACYAKKDSKWDCAKWAKATGNIKKLPERVKAKKNKPTGVLNNPYGLRN